jgi:hypothetical protein
MKQKIAIKGNSICRMPLFIKRRQKGSVKKGEVGFGAFIRPRNECVAVTAEPEFINLLRSPGIDFQPGRIDSWAP